MSLLLSWQFQKLGSCWLIRIPILGILVCTRQNEDTGGKKYTQVSAVIKSNDGRVAVPDGLVLKENLDDLKSICGDGDIEQTSSS